MLRNTSKRSEIDEDDLERIPFKSNQSCNAARAALQDYYGTAALFSTGAYGDLEAVDELEDNKVFQEASSLGLI